MQRSRRSIAPLSIFVLLACACERPPSLRVSATDSAEVRISLSPDHSDTFGEVDPNPVVSIGGPTAEGAAQFFRIQHVALDSSGRYWVADGQSNELRVFDSSGEPLFVRGGRGEGPGEFNQIRLLGTFRGDSIMVGDRQSPRLTVYDPEGVFVRTQALAAPEGAPPRPVAVYPDGAVLGQLPRMLTASSLEPGEILSDTVRLVSMSPLSSDPVLQATAGGPLWIWTGTAQIPVPFTTNAGFALIEGAVHLVTGSEFRIQVFREGRLIESYGVERPIRSVTPHDLQTYRTFVNTYVPEQSRAAYLESLTHAARPSQAPAYSRLVPGSDGIVWAQRYNPSFDEPGLWDVFGGDRTFLGSVTTPERFTLMHVSSVALVGVWRDSLGVEHLRSYQLVK